MLRIAAIEVELSVSGEMQLVQRVRQFNTSRGISRPCP